MYLLHGKKIALSIIIAFQNSEDGIEACLRALHTQRNDTIEIIVVDSSGDSKIVEKILSYGVALISYPEMMSLPVLLGVGIAHSRGEVVAVTDAACVVEKNWIEEILKAHRSSSPAIGGAVEAGKIQGLLNWAAYFCDYGQFMLPLFQGAAQELPGNNISFKKSLLDTGQEYVKNAFWKSYWCEKLKEEGVELVSVPTIVVRYNKSFRLVRFLMRRVHHGRCFAGMRRISPLTRVYYILGSLALPAVFLFRIVRSILPKKRYLKEFMMSLPFSILAVVSWSVGEFWGYLNGMGNSCNKI